MFRKVLAGLLLVGGLLAMPSASKADIFDDLMNIIPGGQEVAGVVDLVRDVGRVIGSQLPQPPPFPGALPGGPPPIPPPGVPLSFTYLDPEPPPGHAPRIFSYQEIGPFTWRSTRNGAIFHEVHRSPEAVIIRNTTVPEFIIIHADGAATIHHRANWRLFVRGTLALER